MLTQSSDPSFKSEAEMKPLLGELIATVDKLKPLTKVVDDILELFDSFSGKDLKRALLNLALLEDGHPCHTKGRENFTKVLENYTDAKVKIKAAVQSDDKATSDAALDAAFKSLDCVINLLLTYSFDVSRRFAVMHFALKHLHPAGPPAADELLKEFVKEDDEYVNSGDNSAAAWEERARRTGELLHVWHVRIPKYSD
jgi:hypothetical protein